MIELEDITIQVGQRRFFEHTDWLLEDNQHWAIVGPAGSGKSMLGRAIQRKAAIVAGRIRYFFDAANPGVWRAYPNPGEILTVSSETHQKFLRLYANYHQARWQSLEGEGVPTVGAVLSPESIQGDCGPAEEFWSKRERVIALLRMEHLLERNIVHLSHGESRKLLIARMLLQSPKVLILDEPLAGLDEESRQSLTRVMEMLTRQSQTQLLYISSKDAEIPKGIDCFVQVQNHRVESRGDRQMVINARAGGEKEVHGGTVAGPFHGPADFEEVVSQYGRGLEAHSTRQTPVFVQMDNVSITYDSVEVLKNINWTVRQGDRWALLGRNGAGKSTLLSLVLADHPQAYKNSISLFGKKRGSGESIWEIKRNIGWVSPELQIFYPADVLNQDVIQSGFFDSVGLYRSISRAQLGVVEAWKRALGLGKLADARFFSVSTGEQRLVLLARALVKNPPLLVLDEPCQGLDVNQARSFLQLIDQICRRTPVTLIYVTHYRDEIPGAITHRLILEKGEAVQHI
jgi:molybdate transport system ATP-binding protein